MVDASPERTRIYLDRTAFYPASGGQPSDMGTLGGERVLEVTDEGDRIAHVLDQPLAEGELDGVIDWGRRFDHMQQHSGQHLLSAVCLELLSAVTVSFHLGETASTIDLARPSLSPGEARSIEERANEIVFANRPVSVTFQDSAQDPGLRKATGRAGEIRIVEISGLDRSACGGTHVRATGEIGPVLVRGMEKIRGNVRLEFLCGSRAVRRARSDYEALSSVARLFSSTLDQTPELARTQAERLRTAEKSLRVLSGELAYARGRELYGAAAPGPSGMRKALRRVPAISEQVKEEARSFAANPKAVFAAIGETAPVILIACSPDSGVDAAELLKQFRAKGGGNAGFAQGQLPDSEAVSLAVSYFE